MVLPGLDDDEAQVGMPVPTFGAPQGASRECRAIPTGAACRSRTIQSGPHRGRRQPSARDQALRQHHASRLDRLAAGIATTPASVGAKRFGPPMPIPEFAPAIRMAWSACPRLLRLKGQLLAAPGKRGLQHCR